MQRNSKKPGKYFYKNMNAQSVQINAAAGERFETQNWNNSTVKNNTYEEITLNQTQWRTSEWKNTATSGYRKQVNQYDPEPS